MRSGHSNKVIGQAGEFAVCSQLGKLGLVATPFSGNVPHFDLIVCDEHLNVIPVQVKATLGNPDWLTKSANEWLDIEFDDATGVQAVRGPGPLVHPDLIHVYVWLSPKAEQRDRFFILTAHEAQQCVLRDYSAYLAKHKGIRPNKPGSFHTVVHMTSLHPFEDRWNLITDRLALPSHPHASL